MPDTNSFVDRIHYDGRREYTKHQGNIAYLDGAPLMRPADMPLAQRVIAIAIVAVAVIIGCVLVNKFVISKWQEATAAEQAVISNLAREASIETIPTVSGLINLNNEDIIASFEKSGYTLHDTTTPDDSGSMSLYKLPSDMSEDDAVPLLLHGIGSLEAQDASRFLVGSWYFGADRVGGTSMVVRYVDFSTGDPQIAVQNAVDKEGFDMSSSTDSGVDESGNTYVAGTLDTDGTTCTWKVSALPLSDIYSISGLPKDACYVGIRVTAQ